MNDANESLAIIAVALDRAIMDHGRVVALPSAEAMAKEIRDLRGDLEDARRRVCAVINDSNKVRNDVRAVISDLLEHAENEHGGESGKCRQCVAANDLRGAIGEVKPV